MKEIVLTDEQVFMLRTMLRSLFSGLVELGDKTADILWVRKEGKCDSYFICWNKDDGCIRIHWLEFCIFYIQPKLSVYISTMVIGSLGSKYINTLYKKFKEIQDANSPRVEEKESN